MGLVVTVPRKILSYRCTSFDFKQRYQKLEKLYRILHVCGKEFLLSPYGTFFEQLSEIRTLHYLARLDLLIQVSDSFLDLVSNICICLCIVKYANSFGVGLIPLQNIFLEIGKHRYQDDHKNAVHVATHLEPVESPLTFLLFCSYNFPFFLFLYHGFFNLMM